MDEIRGVTGFMGMPRRGEPLRNGRTLENHSRERSDHMSAYLEINRKIQATSPF